MLAAVRKIHKVTIRLSSSRMAQDKLTVEMHVFGGYHCIYPSVAADGGRGRPATKGGCGSPFAVGCAITFGPWYVLRIRHRRQPSRRAPLESLKRELLRASLFVTASRFLRKVPMRARQCRAPTKRLRIAMRRRFATRMRRGFVRSARSVWNRAAASWFARFAATTCLARTIIDSGFANTCLRQAGKP